MQDGLTPLMEAGCQVEVVKLLLESNADPNLHNVFYFYQFITNI